MADTLTVEEHYGGQGLTERIEAALERAGISGSGRSWQEFAPLDQFHVRGLEATVELATLLGLSPGKTVLDVGCGLGGPARHLAAEFGVHVTGIDLSESFIEAARMITSKAGMEDQVDYLVGNALDLPFEDASFDFLWTQHVAMNIADRPGLYKELFRVLKPGGKMAIYDVVTGNGEPLVFPVPWAQVSEISHVVTEDRMREALKGAGFKELAWIDKTEPAAEWMERQAEGARVARPLGLHVVMGPEFGRMVGNLTQNVRAGRLRLVQTIQGKD